MIIQVMDEVDIVIDLLERKGEREEKEMNLEDFAPSIWIVWFWCGLPTTMNKHCLQLSATFCWWFLMDFPILILVSLSNFQTSLCLFCSVVLGSLVWLSLSLDEERRHGITWKHFDKAENNLRTETFQRQMRENENERERKERRERRERERWRLLKMENGMYKAFLTKYEIMEESKLRSINLFFSLIIFFSKKST